MEGEVGDHAPLAGAHHEGPGLYEISGLAWSGYGKIAKVEVSADGGKSWAAAALQEPVLPKALTRFRMPWRWDGGPAVLQSRAMDDTGYVQPTREQTDRRARRPGRSSTPTRSQPGAFPIKGEVKHVYA